MTLLCIYDFCVFMTSVCVYFLIRMDVFFVEKRSETPNAQVKTQGCKMSSSQSIPTFKKMF